MFGFTNISRNTVLYLLMAMRESLESLKSEKVNHWDTCPQPNPVVQNIGSGCVVIDDCQMRIWWLRLISCNTSAIICCVTTSGNPLGPCCRYHLSSLAIWKLATPFSTFLFCCKEWLAANELHGHWRTDTMTLWSTSKIFRHHVLKHNSTRATKAIKQAHCPNGQILALKGRPLGWLTVGLSRRAGRCRRTERITVHHDGRGNERKCISVDFTRTE